MLPKKSGMLPRSRRSPRSRGQALVEFALVLVPLLLIFLGILQFAFIYGTQIGLTNAAREAARYAAASVTANSTQASNNGAQVMAQLTGQILPNDVQSFYPGNLIKAGSLGTKVCYESYQDPSGEWSVRVNVDVEYNHPLFIPLISSLLSSNGLLRVGSQVTMPVSVGNQILTTDPGIPSTSCSYPS
jgi:Flp pilus assembly protein TadG